MISKKIFKNTLMLYSRQILLIFISLYTVRVVLNVLGIEEYGVFNVVAGIVTLCSFLTSSMSSATQRFFSFALGKKDENLLKSTFSVNLVIYAGIGLLVVALLEGGGLWFVKNHLNIPLERTDSAVVLYHYTVLSFLFSVITAPFRAIIIAHEDMHYFALVSIIEALMKLAVVFVLLYLPWDKLELYGLLLLFVSIINAIIHLLICMYKYSECQFRIFYWDKSLVKEIFSFTSWTLFGQVSTVARFQAVTILLNQFFNPSVVAARAISVIVSSQVNLFSNNFNTGLYPSIIKSYANKNEKELFSLLFNGSKLTFFLMWVFVLPLLVEMNTVLTLWLNIVPEQAVLFTKLALIESLIFSISLPISTAARAPGKIKRYELTLGVMQLGIFAISYLVLEMGYPAFSVFVVAITMNIFMFAARLSMVSKMIGLSIRAFIQRVCIPVVLVIITSALPALTISYMLPKGIIYSILNVASCILISSVSMYYIGLEPVWRKKIRNMIINKVKVSAEVIR
ncbi:oligosaccharide flippase family protein [Colwellia sp. 12G3]|uniref:oligosaccharide flippase family protein n=1 Tax=Colwellia sp. 12G3 TaxID=2058299 RepID=UPI001E3EAA0E|nr:oligosaccharide flippase family protein [Colwellia sp. 12G3]